MIFANNLYLSDTFDTYFPYLFVFGDDKMYNDIDNSTWHQRGLQWYLNILLNCIMNTRLR